MNIKSSNNNHEVHRIPHPRRVRNPVTSVVGMQMKRQLTGCSLVALGLIGLALSFLLVPSYPVATRAYVNMIVDVYETAAKAEVDAAGAEILDYARDGVAENTCSLWRAHARQAVLARVMAAALVLGGFAVLRSALPQTSRT